jgi:hypothetical protein
MQEWVYFYERSIGCVGVLKDWLIRTVATTLHDGGDTLSLEKLSENALQVGQCERMAIDAIEGEQKLGYMASRREQLWRLLQMETAEITFSGAATSEEKNSETQTNIEKTTSKATKTTSKKRSSSVKSEVSTSVKSKIPTQKIENKEEIASTPTQTTKKRQTRPKTQDQETADKVPSETQKIANDAYGEVMNESLEPPSMEPIARKKKRTVGQRKPKRDPVG